MRPTARALRRRGQLAIHDVFHGLNARDRLVLIDGPDRLPDRRNDRRRLDRVRTTMPLGSIHALVRLFVHAIDRGLQFFRHAAITNLLHDADDRVPVALLAQASELESLAQRRPSRKVRSAKDSLTIATGDSDVDRRCRRIGLRAGARRRWRSNRGSRRARARPVRAHGPSDWPASK